MHKTILPSAVVSYCRAGFLLFFLTLQLAEQAAADEITEYIANNDSSILIMDFELNDLTLHPQTVMEEKRVVTLRPILTEMLQDTHGREIFDLSDEIRRSAQKGKGYLFDRPKVTGQLGRDVGARWVVSGRLHKASFLFVYLKAQLIDAESLSVKSDFVVEIKGWEPRLTRKGVETLAVQIDQSITELLRLAKTE